MNISPVFTPFLALNFSKLAYKSGHYKITGSELKASTNNFLATWGQCKQALMTTLTYYYLLRCYGELRNSCFHIQQTLSNSNTHLEYYFFGHLINLSRVITLLLALFWSLPTPEKYIQLLKTLLRSPAIQYLRLGMWCAVGF